MTIQCGGRTLRRRPIAALRMTFIWASNVFEAIMTKCQWSGEIAIMMHSTSGMNEPFHNPPGPWNTGTVQVVVSKYKVKNKRKKTNLKEPCAIKEARYGLCHRNAVSNINPHRVVLCQAVNLHSPGVL